MIGIITHVGDINDIFFHSINKIIREFPPEVDTIELRISSRGGDVDSGITAYNFLKGLDKAVHTKNNGIVASAAIHPFLAGRIRTAEPISKFMFHPFSIRAEGNLSYPAVEEKMRILENDLSSYATIVKQEAPAFASEHDMIHLLKYETVILSDPDECKRLGILTEEVLTEPIMDNEKKRTVAIRENN